MKAVILAGGFGTRISEESSVRPKPMVEIGNKPILWHIMNIYAHHGINDFVVCCGYKGHVIKDYFARYFLNHADLSFDLANNDMQVLNSKVEPWKVTLIDTGENTMTGGRLKRVAPYLDDETFCLTYGDGVSDVDITESVNFHRGHGGLATLTAVQPPGRFGSFTLHAQTSRIDHFREKPHGDGAYVNGGFFVLEPAVLDLIDGDDTVWERGPLEKLSNQDQLHAYRHDGFWQPMDTLRDRNYLEELWAKNEAPWKLW